MIDHYRISVEDYEKFVGPQVVERIKQKAQTLTDLSVVNINSTYYGGLLSFSHLLRFL